MHVIPFAPPMSGFEGTFNTIRLGGAWAKRLAPGDTVLLMDAPRSFVFGKAEVTQVIVGKLSELAPLHAAQNHNQKGHDPQGAPDRMIAGMIKRYGPQRCGENSRCSIIYLRLIDGEEDNLH